MKKILIIEDEVDLGKLILQTLKNENFDVLHITDGGQAVNFFSNFKPDLVLLDINLPHKNGWEIFKEIQKNSTTPVIIMTARDSELDEIKGLELGAEEYITKPFSLKALILRIKKYLKVTSKEIFTLDEMVFDFNNFLLTVEQKKYSLTKKEAELLNYFVTNIDKTITREHLISEVWGYDFDGEDRAVDALIKRLRKKMGKYSDNIKAIRGVGYVFNKKTD